VAGQNDDIERLLAEMNALNEQAEQALQGGPAADRAQVEKRPGAEAVPARPAEPGREGLPPALLRALVLSGVATGLVWVLFAVVPFIGLGLWDLVAVFLASLLVAGYYTVRGRSRD
jgi:hypothetical protein